MKAGVPSPDGIVVSEVEPPKPKADDVLVRVRAAGLNRADLNGAMATGAAAAAPKPIGMEWAGEVVEVGSAVDAFRQGDRVMCSGSGGYAEYAVTDRGRTMAIPAGMTFERAASLPLALLTMHDAIAVNGRLAKGDVVLVNGASSGVGLIGLQMARLLGAGVVFGTSTTAEKRERLTEFGAVPIDAADASWPERVLRETGGKGADVIVDMVAGASVAQLMKAAALRARIVNVGRLGGAKAEFDFDLHALKRLNYVGVTFRTRSLDEIREIHRRMATDLAGAIASGALTLPIDGTFPLEEAAAAHARMRSNAHFGKLILTV